MAGTWRAEPLAQGEVATARTRCTEDDQVNEFIDGNPETHDLSLEYGDAALLLSTSNRQECIERMADVAESYGRALWGTAMDHSRVVSLLREAYELADLSFNAEAAAEWGRVELPDGIPRTVVDEHEALLASYHGISPRWQGSARIRWRAPG